MARLGVTYAEVEKAATELSRQGRRPTIELIRQLLGTGSSTTIANHLRKLRFEREGREISLSQSEDLPIEITVLMQGLWDRLCSEAQEKLVGQEAQHQHHLAELQQDLQKYKNNNQRWQQLFNQWTKEKEELTTNKIMLQEGLELVQQENLNLKNKVESQSHQIKEKQDRIEELHRLHSLAQANLEHYRDSVREQRLLEQQQYEQQKQEFQSELKLLKAQTMLLQEKNSSLQQQYQLAQQSQQVLEESQAQLRDQLEIKQKNLLALENINTEFQYAKEHWLKQSQEWQRHQENNLAELVNSQAEVKAMNKQVKDLENQLTMLQDQNKLLGHEKWILSQEKAQLEGQLKQMQKLNFNETAK